MEQGGDFLAVTSNFDLFSMKMLPEMLRVFERVLGIGKYWSQTRTIELRNPLTGKFEARSARDLDKMWGRIILRSARAGKSAKKSASIGVSSLESATARAAWLDECGQDDFTIETWYAVKARLSLWRGRVLGTTTLYNHGWMKTEIYDKWKAGSKNIEVVQFDSIENPSFPEEEYYDAKANMPAWKFKMRYQGQYDRPAGAIFTDFDEENAIIAHQEPAFNDTVIIGIDPGGVNTATVYAAMQPQFGRLYVFEEHLEGNTTTAQHAAQIQARGKKQFKVVKVVGGAKSEIQFRADMQENGVKVYEPPVWEVEAGLDRIITLMKNKRLIISKRCPTLISQILEYSREVDAMGEPIEGTIEDKAKFHMVDALRYLCSLIRVKTVGQGTSPVKVEREKPSGIPSLPLHNYQERVAEKDPFDPREEDPVRWVPGL
jgi:hypothetical protein